MNDLKKFLDIVASCKKMEAEKLLNSLHFCEDITMKFTKAKKANIPVLKEINVLDYMGLKEVYTSELIKQIFEYEKDGKYPIWHSFVETFIPDLANSIGHPLFIKEHQNIDVCVTEKNKYAIIFENKLKGAPFKRNQLGRYLMTKKNEGYKLKNMYVVLLPGYIDDDFMTHIRKSAWKAPKDWEKPNDERACKCTNRSDMYACYCDTGNVPDAKICEGCIDWKDKFRNLDSHLIVKDRELPDWLIQTARDKNCVPEDEIYIRSAMIQFAHYIMGLYKIRINKKEIMENIKVLQEKLGIDFENPRESCNKVRTTIDDLNKLLQSLKRLEAICKVKTWQKKIENNYFDVRVDCEDDNFGILIKGIYCGVWINDKNYPYWGFYRDPNRIVEGNKEMVNSIIEKVNNNLPEGGSPVVSDGETADFLAWNWTEDNGFELIASFLNAAKELGIELPKK